MEVFGDGVEKIVYDYNIGVDESERERLLNHAICNMPKEELNNFMMNWAIVDILEKSTDEVLKNTAPRDK